MTAQLEHTVLHPSMVAVGPPQWAGASWVGLLDELPASGAAITLADADGYRRARLLVRDGATVRGVIEVPVVDATIRADAVRVAAERLPAASIAPAADVLPPATVIVCTRERPELLRTALTALLALDYPDVEIVVVDNAPTSSATTDVVADLADERVRLVVEARPGLSRARNRGLLSTNREIVAFTDDDVVVDRLWLRGLVGGLGRADDVACSSGLVPAGELRTPTQAAFEQRVSWASTRARLFRLSEPPADLALFPFQVGSYGTGASFAVRRVTIVALGAFDEALGAGSPTHGGEDIDLFFRVLIAGYALAYEPDAIAWHRHRADEAALLMQAVGYGTGLGAWLAKLAGDRRARRLAVRRIVGGVRRLAHLGSDGSAPAADPSLRAALSAAARAERIAVLRGALRYRRTRRAVRAGALFHGGRALSDACGASHRRNGKRAMSGACGATDGRASDWAERSEGWS